jgi:hypothetical protein
MVNYTMVPGVYPDPGTLPKTDENIFVAKDGWIIKRIESRYIFSFSDPGHNGRPVKIEVLKEDDDYARLNEPTWNEFMERLAVLNRLKELDEDSE